jgi:hypothetical protein
LMCRTSTGGCWARESSKRCSRLRRSSLSTERGSSDGR